MPQVGTSKKGCKKTRVRHVSFTLDLVAHYGQQLAFLPRVALTPFLSAKSVIPNRTFYLILQLRYSP
jgi:hypothetical protein